MTARRVFLIWTNPIFHESTRVLLKHPEVFLVGEAQEVTTSREQILELKPDTILYERTGSDFPASLLEIMQGVPWDLRLIGVSLEDNHLSLLHREHQVVLEAGDLLQSVLG